jgi:mercuric ion transport protein
MFGNAPDDATLRVNEKEQRAYRRLFLGSAIGAAVAAVCCVTPLLVIGLGLVGLAALIPHVDALLLPALAILFVSAVVFYARWRKACHGRCP